MSSCPMSSQVCKKTIYVVQADRNLERKLSKAKFMVSLSHI